jgi:hypothetical protein
MRGTVDDRRQAECEGQGFGQAAGYRAIVDDAIGAKLLHGVEKGRDRRDLIGS